VSDCDITSLLLQTVEWQKHAAFADADVDPEIFFPCAVTSRGLLGLRVRTPVDEARRERQLRDFRPMRAVRMHFHDVELLPVQVL
jgi:hypothetical protein